MKKIYIKPVMDVVNVAPQSMIAASIAASLPSSPGTPPGIGIKANPFDDEEELIDFDSQINGLLW